MGGILHLFKGERSCPLCPLLRNMPCEIYFGLGSRSPPSQVNPRVGNIPEMWGWTCYNGSLFRECPTQGLAPLISICSSCTSNFFGLWCRWQYI